VKSISKFSKREMDAFQLENERVGFWSDNNYPCNHFDIWICELYKHNISGKYSALLTADTDESWFLIEFE
jgi:hypothetical protein